MKTRLIPILLLPLALTALVTLTGAALPVLLGAVLAIVLWLQLYTATGVGG